MYHQLILEEDESGATEEQSFGDDPCLCKKTFEEYDNTKMENTLKYKKYWAILMNC